MTMKTSLQGINLIKSFEGCVLKVYLDAVKVKTLGYGHTGADVNAMAVGTPITQAQADAYLVADLEKFEKRVAKYDSQYHWTQNEFDALVSFAYNIGSIDQLVAKGLREKNKIPDCILLYTKAGGKVLQGLVRRRQAEHDLFVGNKAKSEDSKVATGGIRRYSLAKDGEKKISEHFKVKEFKCKDGSDEILIDTDMVMGALEDIRTHFNAPVTVNSAYRTDAYNKKVGGATNSYHKKGQAFDIVVKGHTPSEVSNYALSIGVHGIIRYNTFTHVDSREGQYHAINDNGKVTTVSRF